ncbi:reverse transcriptase domain-containing protein [Tanacetum coccineum]
MTGVLRHIAEHRLNIREGCPLVRQKRRNQAADGNQAIQEVEKLVDAGIMKEVHYHSWLSNPVMGYRQIKMAKENDEKMTFITSQGIFCYSKMLFGLRNARATYQRLVDKAFHKQIGRNLEVYMDDLVIKIRTEDEIIRDIEETFKTLREINMKLNPKKCTFGVEEGIFLGYKVNTKGIKVCPDKVDVVLSLPSPKCLKDMQKLNGKLASLNRFLAKSAEKSLPFFKTLKKYTKKKWLSLDRGSRVCFQTNEAAQSRTSHTYAPEEKEELIVYLAAAKEAVSAPLMTEREAKQMSIYFVSSALRGPKVSYASMEKLVLALVHASKRLKRYFQAHPIIVITDQPIKQVLSRPEVAGRLQKWSKELGEYAIHYRPRVSIKGQILADFIVERPEEDSSDTPMEVEEELPEPWILFTDGSSCADSSGAGLILTNPEGSEFTYDLRFRLVANQVNGTYIAKEADMIRYLEKLTPITSPWPFYKWGIDIARPFPKGPGKVKFLIVAIDYFTKWIKEKPVATITGNQVKNIMWDNIICRFGLPREIISDNGKQLQDNPFKDWCEKLCIRQCFASIKHPQANGLVEKANQSLGEGIKARLGARNKNWMQEISHVLWAHHAMIKSSNKDTPFSLTYGTEAVILAKIDMPTLRTVEVDMVQNNEALEINLDLLEEIREQAAIREANSKAKMEKYYNSKVRSTAFRPGDLVYRSKEASWAKKVGKLCPKWEGPYKVTKALGKGAYKLRDRDGKQLLRT